MYHCYALLQDALLRYAGPGYLDAEPTDPLAVRLAQNDNLTQEDYAEAQTLIETQRFDFCYPGGLFFPGSARFSDLPVFRDQPFLLVAKKGTTFSPQAQWGPANMYPVLHEALKARLEIVRELAGEELEAWMELLNTAEKR
jgi:hypothetical protein